MKFLKWTMPFVVSGLLLAWIFQDIDFAQIQDKLTAQTAVVFIPALLVFLVVSLLIEAICLVDVVWTPWQQLNSHYRAALVAIAGSWAAQLLASKTIS